MKKFIVAILAMLYVSTSTGATIHLHYCMDKFVGWKLWHDDSNKCDKCGMEKSHGTKGCCKDEHKQVKLENDHQATENFQLQQLFSVGVTTTFFELPAISLPSLTEDYPISHAPPRSCTIPAYLRNCVFLI
jgi:hypothetical protein